MHPLQKAKPGHRVTVELGPYKGTWVKVDDRLDRVLLGTYCNIKTGQILHFSWLFRARVPGLAPKGDSHDENA